MSECTPKDHQAVVVSIEEVRHELNVRIEHQAGKLEATNTRVTVWEGFINSTVSRLHARLDTVQEEIRRLETQQAQNNVLQQNEINALKLHFRYIAGIAAGVGLLLTYFEKLVKFFKP